MTEREKYRPFTGDTQGHISLDNPPLALVLVQIRWPEHTRFKRDFADRALEFGERLEGFPLNDEVVESGIQITPEGVSQVSGETSYQWRSADDSWGINLTKRFVSVFRTRHENYSFHELRQQLSQVLELLDSELQVKTIERIGVRYVNRVTDETLIRDLEQVFDPGVLGFLQVTGKQQQTRPSSSFGQAVYEVDGSVLNVKSGLLAPGETPDPAIQAAGRRSWVLDLDAYLDLRNQFDRELVEGHVGRLADMVYNFFQLVVKPDGVKRLEGAE